ncbi:Zn-ribbon domain-containing OB-fold protein [Neobacillus niacini]|uniref:Zn-ribbon domain-containing OB-fold protein n=1 Tax=Neobacillus niacini TaxID=86668 RepID=UPI0021CB5ECA|nr:Zn-ribbon domain-containing OB-fold protein [Neobacillus niacini]MCM3766204.1 Zn-ribbon domain-containing OB-fold protein [Neobacillus niacini]
MSLDNILNELFPVITESNKPFYDALGEGRLTANKCNECAHTFLPPANHCPNCLSDQVDWTALSGEGTVYSWVEYHRAYHVAFKDKIPYVVAIVQLKEGPRMISNIINYDSDFLKVGMPIQAVFTSGLGDVPIVQFKPIIGKEG